MKINWKRLNRQIHYWGAIICSIPILIVIITGVMLMLKKEINWIQPPTIEGQGIIPELSFTQILNAVKTVPEANIRSWTDISRIDLRPKKGVAKIRTSNNWEIQIDHQTGQILNVAIRRSDIIESLHDGSFFHNHAKLWVFLPAAIILLLLWITGIYLFVVTEVAKKRSRVKKLRK